MWRGRVALVALALLLCAAPAWAVPPMYTGGNASPTFTGTTTMDDATVTDDLSVGGDATVTGAVTIGETLGADVITDSTLAGTCGDANWTCSGAWSLSGGTGTRTANASNLALASKTAVDEGATGTWYRWDITTNLTAGTLTPSFCGQTLAAISTTGALTTTYRLFCPYQAAALGVPTLTAVAATAGTVASMPLYPITSFVSGTGLAFKAGVGGFHITLGATYGDIWQGADDTGLRIHGYDDQQSYVGRMHIDSGSGNLFFSATRGISLYTGTDYAMVLRPLGTGDISVYLDADSTMQLGDGTFSWNHAPMFGLEGVSEFDDKAWFDGGVNITGHATVSGTAPGLSSCGTNPTIVSGSTDHAGKFTIPADGTGCVLTFAADQGTDTACVVGGTVESATWTSSDTALTVTAGPGTYSYVCYGL